MLRAIKSLLDRVRKNKCSIVASKIVVWQENRIKGTFKQSACSASMRASTHAMPSHVTPSTHHTFELDHSIPVRLAELAFGASFQFRKVRGKLRTQAGGKTGHKFDEYRFLPAPHKMR